MDMKRTQYAIEVRLHRLRETPVPEDLHQCDTPEKAVAYWHGHVKTAPWFNADVENFVVLHLNTRRRVISHSLTSTGTLDTLLVHAREVFKVAIVSNAAAVIAMHNHPSGDPSPSEADIKVTRDLKRAGELLKIELVDHVIVGAGAPGFASLRSLGYLMA